MTRVNSFDNLKKKNAHFFIKLTADITETIHTLHIRTATNWIHGRLNQLRMEF